MIRKIFLTTGCLILITLVWVSCKKDPTPAVSKTTAGITFYNASYELNAYLTDDRHVIPLFWDKIDATLDFSSSNFMSAPPQFNRSIYNLQFPRPSNIDYAQLWQQYWKNVPGEHTVIVADTAKKKLFDIHLTTSATILKSLFITDSLGMFRSVLLNDDAPVAAGTVNMRYLNLSPDAGDTFLTIDNKKVTNLSDPVAFSKYHNYAPVVVTRPDTLIVRVYAAADTTNVLSQLFVTVYPGQAYTLFLTGYNHKQSYTDPNGDMRGVSPAPLLNVINSK